MTRNGGLDEPVAAIASPFSGSGCIAVLALLSPDAREREQRRRDTQVGATPDADAVVAHPWACPHDLRRTWEPRARRPNADQRKADCPVSAWPIINWCTSEVPS